jgi:DNA-binding XRE family transcriptional regulator
MCPTAHDRPQSPPARAGVAVTRDDDVAAAMGERVRVLRNAKEMLQQDFAERVGISKSFASEVENGVTHVGSAILLRISEVLGVTTDFLLRGMSAPPKGVNYCPNCGVRLSAAKATP